MKEIKNVRLKHYDYAANGYYFVTVVTKDRQRPFVGGHKTIVEQNIRNMGEIDDAIVDYFSVMADHIHVILGLNDCKYRLGELVRRFKGRVSQALGNRVWQSNYYEHVIRNEKALAKIREYIQNNPEAENIKWEQFYTVPTPPKQDNPETP